MLGLECHQIGFIIEIFSFNSGTYLVTELLQMQMKINNRPHHSN